MTDAKDPSGKTKTCPTCRGEGIVGGVTSGHLGPGSVCPTCLGSGRAQVEPAISPTRRLALAMVAAVPKLGDFSDRDVMRLAEVAVEFLKEGVK